MAYGQQIDWQIFDERGRRKYISASERARFLAAADRQPDSVRALCYVLTYTGCRISEALSLQRFHIDSDRCVITFQTLKRRKLHFRSVPVPQMVVNMLLSLRRIGESAIWPVHRSTAWRWVKRIMMMAQIVGPMACCKGLRHGFGIWAASESVPPNLIQRWMGHASATTTAIYLNAVGKEERLFAQRMWEPDSERIAA